MKDDKLKSTCQHLHTRVEVTGGYYIYGNEIDDDIREIVYCVDCQTVIKDDLYPEGYKFSIAPDETGQKEDSNG